MKISRTENNNTQIPMMLSNQKGANKNKSENAKKIGIAAFSVASTVLPILALSKAQGHKLNKDVFEKLPVKEKGKEILKSLSVDYGFKEMMLVGLSSIAGGVSGGIIFDKETKPKEKVKEGIHKAVALSVPAVLVSLSNYALKNLPKTKFHLSEIASVVIGVGFGMPIANKISNAINKNVFKEKKYEERKIKPSDYLMHVDDIVGAMVLAKVPFVNALQLDKVLGLIYAHEGFEAGVAKGKVKE